MLFTFFMLAFCLLLFSYLVFRVIVRKEYLAKQKLSSFSYLLETLVFALYANFSYFFLPVGWPGLPALPANLALLICSFLLIVFGLTTLLIAWFNLGTSESFGQDKNSLRTTGIYKYSRNPQLVGFGFFLLGFAIMYISWYSIVWFILYLVISWFMILSEEEFLSKKYGKNYKKYYRTVPRTFSLKSIFK